jgi:hypothetical protein
MAVALSSLTNPRCRLPGATLAGPALRAFICRRVRCFLVGV